MSQMRIDESIEKILDAVDTRLKAEQDGGSLDEVKTIVRGDVSSSNVNMPSIWFWADVANMDHTTHGLNELWVMPLVIASVVRETADAAAGYTAATRLAGRAMQTILDVGPRMPEAEFVNDVVPLRFEPSNPRQTNDRRTLFWADAVLNISFRRRQP